MGTHLVIISNHCIDYTGLDFDRLGRKIAERLNQTHLQNLEFYWLSQLYWEDYAGHPARQDAQGLLVPWTLHDEDNQRAGFFDNDSWMKGLLSFGGPFEWEVNVEPGKAEISLLLFQYLGWVGPSEADPHRPLRNAYRKALATLVHSLGGSEVTYLADNSHPLSAFREIADYVTMRHELHERIGPPLTSFDQIEAWQEAHLNKTTNDYREDRAYLIDDFSDLDWSAPITLTPELRRLRARNGLFLPSNLSSHP